MEKTDKFIKLNSEYAPAWVRRGELRFAMGNKKGALEDYTQAIRLNPQCTMAYHNRGFVRWQQKDAQGALADYSQAIHLDSRHATSIYHKLGNYQAALADYNAAIRISPHSSCYCPRSLTRSTWCDQ
ncbi:tetratricopeptide repeat protein [Gloeocapsopsis sp. IPPAS B-1203]|uniref:tetratricopeptide repeat protein n=1 Tax=Gloeocapsopsis sp. IPPAS B-1203 TaxID=2049454 RepID=UPI000C18DC2E|nr:tetratricopeptide repeat protein [Gloeocapsopsis sp. IPPAS B-1203]PIG94493.1 hypothetical protein CSQ79_04195 [Gloeocapsopsis sp. IPPAS B-1203]